MQRQVLPGRGHAPRPMQGAAEVRCRHFFCRLGIREARVQAVPIRFISGQRRIRTEMCLSFVSCFPSLTFTTHGTALLAVLPLVLPAVTQLTSYPPPPLPTGTRGSLLFPFSLYLSMPVFKSPIFYNADSTASAWPGSMLSGKDQRTTCGAGRYITQKTTTTQRDCNTCSGHTFMDETYHSHTACKDQPTCQEGQYV